MTRGELTAILGQLMPTPPSIPAIVEVNGERYSVQRLRIDGAETRPPGTARLVIVAGDPE